MQEEVFRALDAGATLITAGQRLARALSEQYHSRQREQGFSVWATPAILPLGGFLRRAWDQFILTTDTRRDPPPSLLGALEEQALWEQVIRETPEGDSLLRIPETARQAMDAWRLVHAYRLPVDGRFESSEDWAAFAAWTRAFVRKRDANRWIESARLADAIAEALRRGDAPKPRQTLLAGFDEVTPQQSDLFQALGGCVTLPPSSRSPAVEYRELRDQTAEITAAAAWARGLMEHSPASPPEIGVVIPGLEKSRAKVERIFRESLAPGDGPPDDNAFHVSLGPHLNEYPMIDAALLALEFAAGPLPLPRAGKLLRSPFLGASGAEFSKRAQLDAWLRRHGIWDVSIDILLEHGSRCPELGRLFSHFRKVARRMPLEQRPSEWSNTFSELLAALDWPGDRTLSSVEIQVRTRWLELLSDFAALDVAVPVISLAAALTRLRELAAGATFQVENRGAPIQIMGLFEASGLQFEHLWVMGLHDEALPAAAYPNPFLPIALQSEYKLPHSSAELELEFARKLLHRLLASARHAVLSYPAADGDRALGPSPLLPETVWRKAPEAGIQSQWIREMRERALIDELRDETAPTVAVDAMQRGGASLFKDMAACPFRAFAKHRLGAKELEKADLGVNARDQGNAAHRALAGIWNELGSQARLLELSSDQLADLIAKNIDKAILGLGSGIGRDIEKRRLMRLLADWFVIEKSRAPFTIAATEQTQEVTLGGLNVRTRADRLDRLPDGREIIFDYKTGNVAANPWEGDRPEEPQIPLYCATSSEPIAGAAFVVLHTGELGIRGITEPGVDLPDLKTGRMNSPSDFSAQIGEWRVVLEALASHHAAGDAAVDPTPKACEFCRLRALCRIQEYENDRG